MQSPSPFDAIRSLSQRQPLLFLAIAAVVGVMLDSALDVSDAHVPDHIRTGIWVGILLICGGSIARINSVKSTSAAVASLIMVMAFAALDHRLQTQYFDNAGIHSIVGDAPRPTILEGVVDRPTTLRRHPLADQRQRNSLSPWQTRIELSLTRVRLGQNFEDIDGRVQVNVDGRVDELMPGDRIRVYGSIRGIGPSTNPGGYDREAFYRRNRLHARIEVDQPEQIERIDESPTRYAFSRFIATIAASGRDGLLDQLDEQTGPLAVALVIGKRDFVDNATRDQLLVTGTAHVLSVSGMHLAIVVVMTTWIAVILRLPMTLKIAVILGVCVFYCAITGARPPVMRAAVLVSTLMFALWMRRPGQAINTLSLAALVLIVLNPENVFSVGVQLSFLAVTTLILCSVRGQSGTAAVDEAIRQEERLFELAQSSRSRSIAFARSILIVIGKLFWLSGCVTVTSMPLIWHQFNVVSWVSVPANVVLGPFLFLSLASGILTVGCVMLYQPIAFVPAAACGWSLSAMRWVVQLAATVPFGHAWLPSPPTWWVALFYTVLAVTLLMPMGPRTRIVRCGWFAVWMLMAFVFSTHPPPLGDGARGDRARGDGALEATFVDVGHGTSVILRTGNDGVWLYDCGRLGNDTGSSRDIDQALWSLGVRRLDGLFLSHADSDHFNGLPGLLRRFRVDRIYTPPGMLAEPESALDAIRESIASQAVPVQELSEGDEILAGALTLHILHPPAVRLDASDNANSLVVIIPVADKTLLLPGDLEPPGTDVLTGQDRPPPGGVLMAPHHGSLQMDAAAVLQWCRPSETIVSGGQRAERPEVTDMLGSHGSGVHVTARDGAVRVTIDGHGGIAVRTWLNRPW